MRKKLAHLLVMCSIVFSVSVPIINGDIGGIKKPEIQTTSGHGWGLGGQ